MHIAKMTICYLKYIRHLSNLSINTANSTFFFVLNWNSRTATTRYGAYRKLKEFTSKKLQVRRTEITSKKCTE